MNKPPPPPRQPLQQVQYRLLTLWIIGVAPMYFWLMLHLAGDGFEDQAKDIVGWLVTATMPTLLLIAGGLGAGAVIEAKKKVIRKPAPDGSTGEIETLLVPEDIDHILLVDRRFGRIALGISAGYLLLLATALIAGHEAVELETMDTLGKTVAAKPYEALVEDASLLLGPLNGLVSAVLGALFVSGADK